MWPELMRVGNARAYLLFIVGERERWGNDDHGISGGRFIGLPMIRIIASY